MRRRQLGSVLIILLVAGLPSSAAAHPGSGIAVDRKGQVFFLDTGSGLWKIDTQGRLSHLSNTLFHWLVIDEENRFANTSLPSGAQGEIVRVGSDPTVLLSSDFPIAIGNDGNLYYQSGTEGQLHLVKLTPSGATSVVSDFPRTVSGEPLPYLGGIVSGPDGSLYYSEDSAIRRMDPQGGVSTVVTVRAPANPPSIPGTDRHPYLRGLAVSAAGIVFVCDTGDGQLLRVGPNETITRLFQTESPWSPTGVALFEGDVYVLEYLHTERDVRREWSPRVRKIAADGTSRLVATLDQMPGAR